MKYKSKVQMKQRTNKRKLWREICMSCVILLLTRTNKKALLNQKQGFQ